MSVLYRTGEGAGILLPGVSKARLMAESVFSWNGDQSNGGILGKSYEHPRFIKTNILDQVINCQIPKEDHTIKSCS
jgi:hypothetical protein